MGVIKDSKLIRRDARVALKSLEKGKLQVALKFLEEIQNLEAVDIQNLLKEKKELKVDDPLLNSIEIEAKDVLMRAREAIEDLKQNRVSEAKGVLKQIIREERDIKRRSKRLLKRAGNFVIAVGVAGAITFSPMMVKAKTTKSSSWIDPIVAQMESARVEVKTAQQAVEVIEKCYSGFVYEFFHPTKGVMFDTLGGKVRVYTKEDAKKLLISVRQLASYISYLGEKFNLDKKRTKEIMLQLSYIMKKLEKRAAQADKLQKDAEDDIMDVLE